jgi:hypothetical protein
LRLAVARHARARPSLGPGGVLQIPFDGIEQRLQRA